MNLEKPVGAGAKAVDQEGEDKEKQDRLNLPILRDTSISDFIKETVPWKMSSLLPFEHFVWWL
jgi:hypothetical protein